MQLKPDDAKAHSNLGRALSEKGRFDEAITQLQQTLQIKPDHPEAHNNLAWLLATCPQASLRNGAEAVEHAEQANRLSGGKQPDVLDTLAAAYAEAGQFPEAVTSACKALELARQQNKRALVDALRAHIALYEAGKPYHQTPAASAPPPKP